MKIIELIMNILKWSLILFFGAVMYGFAWYLILGLIQQGMPTIFLGICFLLAYLWAHMFMIAGAVYYLTNDFKVEQK